MQILDFFVTDVGIHHIEAKAGILAFRQPFIIHACRINCISLFAVRELVTPHDAFISSFTQVVVRRPEIKLALRTAKRTA